MPNAFAYLMLFSWPLVAQALFQRLPLHKALIWTILGGYLVLPSATGIKLPMIPLLDKHSIPAISAFVLCHMHAPRQPADQRLMPGAKLVTALLILMIVAPFLTVVTNSEPLFFGPRFIPGLRLYDALSVISGTLVTFLPFLLAYRHLNTPEAHRELLRAFAVGGLACSLPALIEVRLSPQLHVWLYGFFAHDFIQHIRAGGFRPILFLSHGLMVGIFFCMSILSALVLWREARREGKPARGWLMAALWLTAVLVLVKSVGALLITLGLGLVIGLLGRRLQILTALLIAGVALSYPILRGTGVIPVEEIHEMTLSRSVERAQSLKFRFDNEDVLLARANEKPAFGWGGWGRNQIFDPVTGEMISVTDGIWVILIGVYGWTGYLAYFGLFTLPIMLSVQLRKGANPSLITPGLMLVLGALLIDFLPNAGLVPYVWMIAGALAGLAVRQVEAAGPDAIPIPKNDERPAASAAPGWRIVLNDKRTA